jgi:hypothetical protein
VTFATKKFRHPNPKLMAATADDGEDFDRAIGQRAVNKLVPGERMRWSRGARSFE